MPRSNRQDLPIAGNIERNGRWVRNGVRRLRNEGRRDRVGRERSNLNDDAARRPVRRARRRRERLIALRARLRRDLVGDGKGAVGRGVVVELVVYLDEAIARVRRERRNSACPEAFEREHHDHVADSGTCRRGSRSSRNRRRNAANGR